VDEDCLNREGIGLGNCWKFLGLLCLLWLIVGGFGTGTNTVNGQFRGYYSPRDSVWVFSMDSVFVRGNRPPELLPVATTTVPEERIEAMGYRDLNEIVTGEVPGILSTEKGVMGYGVADGSAGKLTIRGLGGDPTTGILIAQDGKPEIMGLMGHPVPDAYSADFISEIEVIKGPASILYGSNAMGGVIDMKTKRLYKEGWQSRIRVSGGNYGTYRAALQQGGKTGAVDYFLVYGRRGTGGHRPHSAFRSAASYLHLGYEPSGNAYFALQGKRVPFYMEDPGPINGEVGNEFHITRSDITLLSKVDLHRISLDYKVYHNWGEHRISDGFHSRDYSDGFSLQHNLYLLPGNATTIGVDYMQVGGKLLDVFKPLLVGKVFRTSGWAVYLFTEQQAGRLLKSTFGLRFENHSVYGAMLVPQAGISLRLTDRVTAFVTAGKGFRNPTIRELYLFPAPNPDLQPEQTTTTQLGVRYEPAPTLSAHLTYYHTRGNNLIETRGQWPDLRLQNAGEALFQGMEVALKYIPATGLHLGLNYSTFYSDIPVTCQPAEHLEVSATHHGSWYTLRYKFRWVKGVQNFINDAYITLPAYTVATLGLELVPFEFGHLFFTLDNLWNVDYQSMSGYPMPGRTVEGGMIFEF